MSLLLQVHSFVASDFLVGADRAAVTFIGMLSVRTAIVLLPAPWYSSLGLPAVHGTTKHPSVFACS
jgi:hypothetical protein